MSSQSAQLLRLQSNESSAGFLPQLANLGDEDSIDLPDQYTLKVALDSSKNTRQQRNYQKLIAEKSRIA